MCSAVKQYRDGQPLFSRMGVESQLDAMFSPTVQLRSGGYIVINQTEALVSIDVNSGRSTREHHIEDTALKTNLEAAEEVARQLRLRDLAGLIVIDFIDMDEKRNNRAVERKLSDCLRQDRARIQVGRISHFGLLEMSRQRIRASVLESSTEPCPHCGGTGHVRSVSSVALQLLRGLEEILMKGATHNLVVRTRTDVALYVLNHKRGHLRDLENGFKVTLAVIADPSVSGAAGLYHRPRRAGAYAGGRQGAAGGAGRRKPAAPGEDAYDDEEFDPELESEVETEETEGLAEEQAGRRRRYRAGRPAPRSAAGVAADAVARATSEPREDGAPARCRNGHGGRRRRRGCRGRAEDGEEGEDQAARGEQQGSGDRRPPAWSPRRPPPSRWPGEEGLAGSIGDELAANAPSEATDAVADFDGFGGEAAPSIAQAEHTVAEPQVTARAASRAVEAPAQPEPAPAAADEEHADDKAARRRSTVREKVSFLSSSAERTGTGCGSGRAGCPARTGPEPAPAAASETSAAPRRAGWWSRRFGGGE